MASDRDFLGAQGSLGGEFGVSLLLVLVSRGLGFDL